MTTLKEPIESFAQTQTACAEPQRNRTIFNFGNQDLFEDKVFK